MKSQLVYKVSFLTGTGETDDRYFYSMTEAGKFIDNVMWKETVDRINLLQYAGSDEAQSLRQRTTATISIVTMADVPDLE